MDKNHVELFCVTLGARPDYYSVALICPSEEARRALLDRIVDESVVDFLQWNRQDMLLCDGARGTDREVHLLLIGVKAPRMAGMATVAAYFRRLTE